MIWSCIIKQNNPVQMWLWRVSWWWVIGIVCILFSAQDMVAFHQFGSLLQEASFSEVCLHLSEILDLFVNRYVIFLTKGIPTQFYSFWYIDIVGKCMQKMLFTCGFEWSLSLKWWSGYGLLKCGSQVVDITIIPHFFARHLYPSQQLKTHFLQKGRIDGARNWLGLLVSHKVVLTRCLCAQPLCVYARIWKTMYAR